MIKSRQICWQAMHFLYQGNHMYCDSAVLFKETNYIKAYGNVHINKKGEMNLFVTPCGTMTKQTALLWDKCPCLDQEYKLTTDSMEYNSNLERAVYRHGGQVESIDGKEVLTSKIGYFFPTRRISFSRTVWFIRAKTLE